VIAMYHMTNRSFGARGTLLVGCLVFLGNGMALATIGPALPNLAAKAGCSLAALGGAFTTLFLGALLVQLVAGPLHDRLGQQPFLRAGLLSLALGALALTISRALPLTLTGTALIGMGFGLTNLSTSVLIAEVITTRRAAALNLLNVFFGIGAVSGTALAGATLRLWGTALPPLALAASLLLVPLPLVRLLAASAHRAAPGTSVAVPIAIYRSPMPWILGAILLFYIGAEHGTGGWTAAYLQRTTPLDAATASLVVSGFWLALTCGRALAAALGLWVQPQVLLCGSIGGALASGLLLTASTGNVPLTLAAVLLLGLCLGPIYPTTVALVTATFYHAPGTAAGIAVAMSSAGGVLLPWLQGIVLERNGPAFSVLLVAGDTMMMLAFCGLGLLLLRTPRPTLEPCPAPVTTEGHLAPPHRAG